MCLAAAKNASAQQEFSLQHFRQSKCKKCVCSLRLHLSTFTCRLCSFFFMFGTLYVDAVKGRKLLTFCRVVDGFMDVQEPSVAGDFGI